MTSSRNIHAHIALWLIFLFTLSGCAQIASPTATSTPIPPTATQTPAPPTATPSLTPEPVLTAETITLIRDLAAELEWTFFVRDPEWKKTSVEESMRLANELGISLSAEQLNTREESEQQTLAEKLADDILAQYGTRGRAFFSLEYFGDLAYSQMFIAHSLEYKDIEEMRARIALAADYFEEVVQAASDLSLDAAMIADGEETVTAIRDLLNAELPTKDAIEAASTRLFYWNVEASKALDAAPN